MSSPVHTLLAEVARLGIRLYVRGGRVIARPHGRLPSELRERIAASKAELLDALGSAPTPTRSPPARPGDRTEEAPSGPGCRRCGQSAKVLTAPKGWCIACALRAQARDDRRRAEEAERRGETSAERCAREAREYRKGTDRRWEAIRRGEWPGDPGPGGGRHGP